MISLPIVLVSPQVSDTIFLIPPQVKQNELVSQFSL